MAKGLLKKILEDQKKEIFVASAGVAAMPGFRPTRETIEVMAKHGIDISTHLSQRLTPDMVDEADIVLVMERIHRHEILNHIPRAKKKIFLLREFAGVKAETPSDLEIPDPISKSMEVYENCFKIIEESVQKVVQKL